MIKLIKKFHTQFILCIILLLAVYTISYFLISKEILKDKIAFIAISWFIFLVTLILTTLFYKIQSYNIMISKKVKNIIISLYIILSLFLTVIFIFRYIFNPIANNYMILFPINGISIASIKEAIKGNKGMTGDGSLS